MKSEKTTIAGHQFGIQYNFATEIAFEDSAGEKFPVILQQEGAKFSYKHMLQVVIAAIMSYYNGHPSEPMPTGDHDLSEILLNEANFGEIEAAAAQVINLANEWYHLPKPEADKLEHESKGQKGKTGKNAKRPMTPTPSPSEK